MSALSIMLFILCIYFRCQLRFSLKNNIRFILLLCNGFMSHLCYFYLFYISHTGVGNDFHITWCSCRLSVTRQVPLAGQELLHASHTGSPPAFSEVHVVQALVYHVVFLHNCLSSSFLCWSMYCLSIDLLFLITSLVSSFYS
jgi:hypothetical protein